MNIFSNNTPILSSELNHNFNELKTIIQSRRVSIEFDSFQSGDIISADVINNQINKISQFGVIVPSLSEGLIKSEDLNAIFQSIKATSESIKNGIKESAGVRTYYDDTLARSCLEYKTINNGRHFYGSDVGTGVYKIKLHDNAEQLVYCDMVTDGGGWTLVIRQFNHGTHHCSGYKCESNTLTKY